MLSAVGFMNIDFIYFLILELDTQEQAYLRYVTLMVEGQCQRVSRNTKWLVKLPLGMDWYDFCPHFID